MNFFHHKDLGNHLLQLCPNVVKHPVDWNHSPILTLHLGEINLDVHHLDLRRQSQDHLQCNFRGVTKYTCKVDYFYIV